MPWRPLLILLVIFTFAPAAAIGQQGAAMRLRGTIVSVDGDRLTINAQSAGPQTLRLPQTLAVNAVERRTIDDIGDGDFIGTTAVRDKNGQWQAVEVHIFPASLRGTGEGHRPWDLLPDSTMTNADVSGSVRATDDRLLSLTYEGGKIDVSVTPQTAIVALVPGERSLLKPGAAIFAIAMQGEDGVPVVRALTVEKDGVKPPM